MKELFERFLMYLCFAGLGGIAVFSFVRVTLPTAVRKARAAAVTARKHGVVAVLAVTLFVSGMIVYGSTKNNASTNDPPARIRMAVRSSSNALVRVEKWWRRGAYDDGQILTFDEDWCFPYGTNHLTSVEVWASGAVYPSEKNPTPIAGLVTKLSLAPHDTEVFMGRTTNNTYRIEWHNGHPNRDLNQTADASIELFRNGNAIVTENGAETEIPYVVPFEHVGFGQNDDWVRANFDNAEEILSVGYTNWVVQTVGLNEANGLFYLTATFDEDPPEPCHLSVGGLSVAVNEGGTYYFLLPVFEEHELHCWPYPELVRYEIDDGYTGEGTSYRLSCSPGYSSRMMARSRTRTSSGSDDLRDGNFFVEPLVVTDPPTIPVRAAENATVSSFWNVSAVSSLIWTDQQGEIEFADATAPSTTISHVLQPTTLTVAMNDGTHEATGYVAIHGDGDSEGEPTEPDNRADASADIASGTTVLPSDETVDDMPVRWFALSGNLDAGKDLMATNAVVIPPGRTCYIGAFAGSQEYPDWTGRNSQYNDAIYWSIKTNNVNRSVFFLRKYVNELQQDFVDADDNDHSANSLGNVVHVGGTFLSSGDTNLTVTLISVVRNVGDGKRESTALFGVFPVTVKQSNYPRTTGRNRTTDGGGAGTNTLIKAGGVAYITGEPAMASLTAKIRGLPDWIETAWSGYLTTERTRRGVRDNRVLIVTNIIGSAAFNINAALTNETVGGKCVLRSRVDDKVTGSHEFFIRGKNPLDTTVRAYITENVDEEFRSYAWKLAKHETIVGLGLPVNGVITNAMCYNQFNPTGQYKELPNLGAPDGWGIGQIDRSGNEISAMNYTTTKEVYDWHSNVDSMNEVLRDKRARYLEIIRLFRNKYQNDHSTNWVEPNVATNLNGTVLTAREWSIITLYNGARGCDDLSDVARPNESSPIHFDPTSSTWRLSTNVNNYAPSVISEAGVEESD